MAKIATEMFCKKMIILVHGEGETLGLVFQETGCSFEGIGVSKKRWDVLELTRGRLYPLFSGNNDISLCKGSKCRDDC